MGLFVLCMQSGAQDTDEPVFLDMSGAWDYAIVERSDWRRYENGKYVGLVRNEVRASVISQPESDSENAARDNGGNSTFYHGNFFVLQSTLRDMRQSAQPVDAIIPVSFELMRNGSVEIEDDRGFPMMRGFPFFINKWITRGDKWAAPGKRAVDPLNTGQVIVIPFTAEYEYRGVEYFGGMLVHRVRALYGYSYRNPVSMHPYAGAMGKHKVDILIRVADGFPVHMRDDLNITYTLADRSTVEFRGFTLTFNTSIMPLDRGAVMESLEGALGIETPKATAGGSTPVKLIPGLQNSAIDLEPVPEGIKLTIKNIQFIADSPQFLPSELARLDLLAQALRTIPDRTFLVEGHTASTGQAANEMQLSVERALSIINEMVKRGIGADRFIYKGWGGTRPIGDNATDSGRSANRRVEITILE